MTPASAEPIAKRNIFVNAHFHIEPCASCPIPGYLIVSPRVPVSSLAELSPDAQAALGATLVAATRTIEAVVQPQRVYCALFAEETRSVHFHLFPRSDWVLSQHASAHPADLEISGPRLLDWARRTFHPPNPSHYIETVEAIFREVDQNV